MLKKPYKLSIYIIVIGLICSILLSRHGRDSSLAVISKYQLEKDEKIKISMWIYANTSHNIQTKLLDEFNKKSDKIQVDYEVFGDNYANMLTIALKSGSTPDIFEVPSNWSIPKLVEDNYIEPIDEYLDKELRSQFYPSIFLDKEYVYKGKIYALPERYTYYTLLYNKGLFQLSGLDPDRPPKTLEELRQYAKQITEHGEGKFYGFILPMKSPEFIWKSIVDNLSAMHGQTAQFGFDWEQGKFDFMKQKPFLELILQLRDDQSIFPNELYIDEEKARVLFAQNKVGMMVSGNFMSNVLENQIKSDAEWDFVKMPVFENQIPPAAGIIYLTQARAISSSSQYKESAWEVLEYIFKHQDMTIQEGDTKSTIIRANHMESKRYLQGYDTIKNLSIGYTSFHISPTRVLNIEGITRDELYLKIYKGETNIDELLKEMSNQYNNALKEAIQDGKIDRKDIQKEAFSYYMR